MDFLVQTFRLVFEVLIIAAKFIRCCIHLETASAALWNDFDATEGLCDDSIVDFVKLPEIPNPENP